MNRGLVRAAERGPEQLKQHPLNPLSEVHSVALSDLCGLTRTGVSLLRVPAGRESFAFHAHHALEEWMYVLSGTARAEVDDEVVEIGPGDFLAFPTPSRAHHTINPGPSELVYLAGGERSAVEIGEYPRHGLRIVLTPAGRMLYPLSAQVGWDGEPTPPLLVRCDKPYLLRASERGKPDGPYSHPLNPKSEIRGWTLADVLGLQRCGVHLMRVPPGKESFALHAHSINEEWMFVLAGNGIALVDGAEEQVGPGDFLGFTAPSPAHHLRNDGTEELVYLTGGERKPVEVADFPGPGLRLVRTPAGMTLFPISAGTGWPER